MSMVLFLLFGTSTGTLMVIVALVRRLGVSENPPKLGWIIAGSGVLVALTLTMAFIAMFNASNFLNLLSESQRKDE
jgi:uncharacterized protein involved in cysteine biosynthesis